MAFPFALSRIILLVFIVIANIISLVFSVTAFHDKTGGVFQVMTTCFDVLGLLTVISYVCHQFATRGEEVSNTRNLGLFGVCGLLSIALVVSLTVHARQRGGMDFCNDFANAVHPCVLAGTQLGMAYITSFLTSIGFITSWLDKFPGVVKVTPRYPITKAPSSHFTAHAHDLDGNYTYPPVKTAFRSWNNLEWSDVPLHC